MRARQGCSSLLTLISSGFVLAPHPVVSVVTLMFGLPDVARAETGLGGGVFVVVVGGGQGQMGGERSASLTINKRLVAECGMM